MSYGIGIDVGTTFSAAAVSRGGRVVAIELSGHGASVPSVLFFGAEGSVQVGDAAVRRAVQEPERVAREFKRRVGDPAPVIIGGSPYSADGLVARLLSWMVDAVSAREGGRPSRVCLTHPANWGPYKRDLMRQAAQRAGIAPVTLLTEPEAAAACYAATERVEVGSTVAVYDLGGGTFDAAVLRKTPTGFEILGSPQGIERLGGIDFDEAIFAHVRMSVGTALDKLDPANPADLAAAVQLRAECVAAKEALSADTEAAIAVLLPEAHTTVRLTRGEFEQMIRPAIAETVTTLRRTVESAGLRPEQLDAVLLVGGSSRIPLVSQLVSAELGRPIASDISPTNAVAIGAALTVDPQPARAAARPAPVVGAARAASVVPSRGAAPSPVAKPRPSPPARPVASPSARPVASPSARPVASPSARPAAAQRPKRPTAVLPVASAAQPRTPVRASSGGVVTPARGAASGRPPNQRRWIAPTAAAIVGVLAAAALVWLFTNSGTGTSSSRGPETTATTEALTRATTDATTPTSTTATTPPRNTVASLIQNPCSALTAEQAAALKLSSPGRETSGVGCRWAGENAPEVDVSAASGPDIYSEVVNNPGGWAHLNRVEVAGRQAVQYGASGACNVTVRVGPNESITTGSRASSSDPNGCDRASAAAQAVLANF